MIRVTHSNCTANIQTHDSQSPKPKLFTIPRCLVSLNDENYTKALRVVKVAGCGNYLSNGSEKQHYLNIKPWEFLPNIKGILTISDCYSELLVLEQARAAKQNKTKQLFIYSAIKF